MPGVAAAIGGIGSVIGGLASGAAGIAAGAASAIAGTAGGLVSGVGSLFAPAAGITVGQQMASMAEPAYYEAAGAGILGGVTSAASQTMGYLGSILPTVSSAYQIFKPPEQQLAPVPAARYMPSVPAPVGTRAPLPILSAAPPVVLTREVPAKMEAKTDYMIYIALGILALFIVLRKK